jgi:hemoglobin-like flavoprotein
MQNLITRDECRLVQVSFSELEPLAESVAATFYGRLLELNPSLIPLFTTDMNVQGVKFMEKLAVLVVGLEDLDSITPLVQTLGRAHAGYGIEPAHYAMARDAFFWTLEDRLGPAFNPELRRAWSAAFDMISAEMIRAADG